MATEKAKIPMQATGAKIKLTVKDRLTFQQLFPKQSNLINQTLVRDIDEKVSLTQEEQKLIGLKAGEGGVVRWSNEADRNVSKNVKFTGAEINFLKAQIDRLDKEEKISQDILNLCLKIREAKIQEN